MLEVLRAERRARGERPAPGRGGRTVPVPPRVEGGLSGGLGAVLVLGVEVLAALATAPFAGLLGWLRRSSPAAAEGSPPRGSAAGPLVLVILAALGAIVILVLSPSVLPARG